jgi:hypothetical protein
MDCVKDELQITYMYTIIGIYNEEEEIIGNLFPFSQVALCIAQLYLYCSVQSRYYATTARYATGQRLGK